MVKIVVLLIEEEAFAIVAIVEKLIEEVLEVKDVVQEVFIVIAVEEVE